MGYVLLGGPGAGKGTQAKYLSQHLGLPWISTGNLLHQEIATGSDLGQRLQPIVEAGDLVQDELMIALMRQRLQQPDLAEGWLLDGYPRTAVQAEELDFVLSDLGQRVDWAIWLEVPVEVLQLRSQQRDRSDDSPDAIARRIALTFERTVPILDYYEYRQRLLRIDGNQPQAQVSAAILAALATV